MGAPSLVVDPSSSRIFVRTRASGMLARLAHDLELAASSFTGETKLEGQGFSAELSVPVAGLSVMGTLHGDRVDTSALSASDRSDIEQKIRNEVFAGAKEIRATVRGASRDRGEVTMSIGAGRSSLPVTLRVADQEGSTRVSGRVELSMKKLGLREVKGPLNAFRVSDLVEVIFDVTLRPAS